MAAASHLGQGGGRRPANSAGGLERHACHPHPLPQDGDPTPLWLAPRPLLSLNRDVYLCSAGGDVILQIQSKPELNTLYGTLIPYIAGKLTGKEALRNLNKRESGALMFTISAGHSNIYLRLYKPDSAYN